MKKALFIGIFLVVIGFSTLANSELQNNGNGLIYDTDLNITWYDYTYGNPPSTGVRWADAVSWAQGLNVGGVTGWRLPRNLPLNGSTYNQFADTYNGSTDKGENISAPGSAYPGTTASEMAYLFYVELGNKAYVDVNGNAQSGYGLVNTGPFKNLVEKGQSPYPSGNLVEASYWSGSVFIGQPPVQTVFLFSFLSGRQACDYATDSTWPYYALAVHDGNVGAPAITEVEIDIRPWSHINIVSLWPKWEMIPVAILSTQGFSAPDKVDHDSLTFGYMGNEKSLSFCEPWHFDVNRDGHRDLICFFHKELSGFQCGDAKGILKGITIDGTPIEGSDLVKIFPCK